MIAVIFGIILLIFAVFACIPTVFFGLGWYTNVVQVLKGASPIIALIVGIFALLVGIADIRDKQEAAKDEAEAIKAEEELQKESQKK